MTVQLTKKPEQIEYAVENQNQNQVTPQEEMDQSKV